MRGVRLDAWLKRYFPFVVGLLLLASAYFQARGLGYLAGAAMIDDAPVTKRPAPKIALHHEEEHVRPSGNVILERNPFDSLTGPLVPDPTLPPPPTDPLGDPPCEVGMVTLIVWSEDDPAWSFAAIAGPDGVHLHRQGDELGGFQVAAIGPDRIWLTREGRFCQIEVHDIERRKAMEGMRPPMNEPPRMTPPMNGNGPQSAPPATPGKRPKGQLPPHIAERIRQTGPNQYDIDRTVVDEILTNQAEYLQKVRVVPARQGDQTVGMKIMGVRKGTALDAIGLRHGDQLQSINGFEMTNPQNALEAYARLTSANQIRVNVIRNGQPTTLELNIK